MSGKRKSLWEAQKAWVEKMTREADFRKEGKALIVLSVDEGNYAESFSGEAKTLAKMMAMAVINLVRMRYQDEAKRDEGIDAFCDVIRSMYVQANQIMVEQETE